LIGKYPADYDLAVMRNPVTDLVAQYTVTDIPDWVLSQTSNDQFDFINGRNRYDVVKGSMIQQSPVHFIDNVKTPVLLQLGKKDRRVPINLGLRYYENLKARNVPVKLFTYDSNHALAEVIVASDCFVNTILFIDEYFPVHSE
ncbi:unnamed protein product, partial [Didymodactylos carnosus]